MTSKLIVLCEGQTEQGFCQQVLQPELFPAGEGIILPELLRTSRRHRGGVKSYGSFRHQLEHTLRRPSNGDGHTVVTTMFDLYALPTDFPQASARTGAQRAELIESAMADDASDRRFVPYLQVHEFETLLFCGIEELCRFFDGEVNFAKAVEDLSRQRDAFASVEDINNTPDGAPSKRISRVIPTYASLKRTLGPAIAEAIGVQRLSEQSPHLTAWIGRLRNAFEVLAREAGA